MEYQLEVKQIVDFPRCRIYRDFIRTLSDDKNIRLNGSSNLYYYIVLCSYANFRSSTHGIEGVTYTVYPGEWICKPSELVKWFRCRFQWQAMKILEHLQKMNLITITRYDHKNLIKFKIVNWKKSNKILEYNYPCQKDDGFFFFPIAIVSELIGNEKCSEMDIVLDLWINAIYNDEQVRGSEAGPVVYFRNCTGNPLISYVDLSLRWSVSKSSVCRILNKFQKLDYLTLVTFQGRYGTVIYLNNYLSVMFDISDISIDKDEVALSLKLNVANRKLRTLKTKCHDLFDKLWETKEDRYEAYLWLALKLDIPEKNCHFGWFDEGVLNKAIKILEERNNAEGVANNG